MPVLASQPASLFDDLGGADADITLDTQRSATLVGEYVIIETALGTFKVPIQKIQWSVKSATDPNATRTTAETNFAIAKDNGDVDGPTDGVESIKDDTVFTDVVTPIHRALPAFGTLEITAEIPVTIPEAKAIVTISANPLFFNLISSKTIIDVITTIITPQTPPLPPIVSRTVQPYNVTYVILPTAAE
ncbi:hypothetical protein B0H63DRAFT_535148 [Podospora didyma]|uniref:Uncharacterized protein n=1 Tax=Podospora didyma TaxID=330526 RepID=A0AAE0K2B0_9PEZI|nr:hypothetical protein B0H63DRAFT_535148 [Podospora didyma]